MFIEIKLQALCYLHLSCFDCSMFYCQFCSTRVPSILRRTGKLIFNIPAKSDHRIGSSYHKCFVMGIISNIYQQNRSYDNKNKKDLCLMVLQTFLYSSRDIRKAFFFTLIVYQNHWHYRPTASKYCDSNISVLEN